MIRRRQPAVFADNEALEARLAASVSALLNERSAALPHDVSERLRHGRERALERAREMRRPAAGAAHAGGGAAVLFGGPSPWWLRVATWLPLVLLVGGLVAIEEWTAHEQVLAAAEIDAILLADDLPPDAWTDPGFREFFKSPQR
jgi:hypothetical protein